MIHDDLESYENSSEVIAYADDENITYKSSPKVANDKIRLDKRRRLDELLEERRLKSELDLYKDPIGQGSYYNDDIFSEA